MLISPKQSLGDYVYSLTIYDYVAFGWLAFLLIVIFSLSVMMMMRKKLRCSILLMLVTIFLIFAAPISIKLFLDKSVRKVAILDQNHTILNFSKSLIVTAKLENRGKIDLHKCYINSKVLKTPENFFKDILNYLKPIEKKTIILTEDLSQNQIKEFKVVFENFKYSENYDVIVKAECY